MKKILMLFMMSFLFLTACDNTRKGMEKDAADWSAEMQSEFSELEKNMNTWQSKINAELQEIDTKMDNANEEMAEELKERKAELEQMQNTLNQRMKNAEAKAKENWIEFKNETSSFFTSIQNALDKEIEIEVKEG